MTEKLIKVVELDQLLPGARKLCTFEGRRIALFNLDGTTHAIDNHCTHRYGPVGAGELKDAVITCPWHGRHCWLSSSRNAAPMNRSAISVIAKAWKSWDVLKRS
ncbi:MAG: Rieske 2Fe-2S domain-containing protein [Pirellulales bacterium]|nr:Rieske 2Fe-2S domain-containing protein [Pirellulales bacterium]